MIASIPACVFFENVHEVMLLCVACCSSMPSQFSRKVHEAMVLYEQGMVEVPNRTIPSSSQPSNVQCDMVFVEFQTAIRMGVSWKEQSCIVVWSAQTLMPVV